MKKLNLTPKLIHLSELYISPTEDITIKNIINQFLLPLRNNRLRRTKIYGIRVKASGIHENNKQI